jgi:hypothetical protein
MDTAQHQTMVSEPLPKEYLEASKVYDAFINAIALPAIYGKDSIALAVAQLEHDYDKHKDDFDDIETALYSNYIYFLKILIHASN